MPERLPETISEEMAREILLRAASIDGRSPRLALAELRTVAQEAGIRDDALERAIREVMSESAPGEGSRKSRPGWKERLPKTIRSALIGIGAFAGGALTWLLGDGDFYAQGGIAKLGFGLLILLSIKMILRGRERRDQEQFQTDLIALWLCFNAGWSYFRGGVWEDMLTGSAGVWLALAVVGGLVIHIADRKVDERMDKAVGAFAGT